MKLTLLLLLALSAQASTVVFRCTQVTDGTEYKDITTTVVVMGALATSQLSGGKPEVYKISSNTDNMLVYRSSKKHSTDYLVVNMLDSSGIGFGDSKHKGLLTSCTGSVQ